MVLSGSILTLVGLTIIYFRVPFLGFTVLPPDMSKRFQLIARFGRGILVSRYLTHYAKRRELDHDLLAQWFVVCAAARLSEGIDEENEALAAVVATWCDQDSLRPE